MIGRTLSHYEILGKLGEGGMGVVYKARDVRLGRIVAIKVLPPEKTADQERKRRFIQEAQAASALNHPSIVTIYDIGSEDGTDFIVMEYVAGRPLDEVIPEQGMRMNDALNCAIAVADGLAKAHAAGIVHRDLKPANILIANDGTPKVLDFGLAKLLEDPPSNDAETRATNRDAPITEEGLILGTVAYMSPEQAEGKPVDSRSDIFSFGVLLYEMLTGHKAFRRGSRLATLAAILREEPQPIRERIPSIPREIERLIARCLRKDPANRWQSLVDLRTSLQEVRDDSDSGALRADGPAATQPAASRFRILVPAAVILLAAGVFGIWRIRGKEPTSAGLLTAAPLTSFPGSEDYPALSPEGNDVAFSWNESGGLAADIYVKRIGSGRPLRLTQNSALEDDPAWSPDGNWIAFRRAISSSKDALLLIPPLGGPERAIAEVATMRGGTAQGLTWSPDGKWLVANDRPESQTAGLWLISVETGERRRLTTVPEGAYADFSPAFSPDGRTLVFTRNLTGRVHDLYLLSLDPNLIPDGEPRRLTHDNLTVWNSAWMPDGRSIIVSSGTPGNASLWRVEVAGNSPPTRLTFQVDALKLTTSARSNRLVFCQSTRDLDIHKVSLDAQTGLAKSVSPLIVSSRLDRYPSYSPDGSKVAFASLRTGDWQLWTTNGNGEDAVQLTFLQRSEVRYPVWSGDGRQIMFEANPDGAYRRYSIDMSGGKPRLLDQARENEFLRNAFHPPGLSIDGNVRYFADTGIVKSKLVSGGQERELFKTTGSVFIQAGSKGIYSVLNAYPLVPGDLFFYPFPNGPLSKIVSAEAASAFGLSLSPDNRELLYVKMSSAGADLMLVEGFK